MKTMGKLWETYENYRKNYGKPIENDGEILRIMGKSRGKT